MGFAARQLAMNPTKIVQTIVITAAALAFAGTSAADAYSQKVKNACSSDFASLCGTYKQNSPQLRRCFESKRRMLSRGCVEALVNAGEVPARYLRQR